MDALRRQGARLVPGDEHDEGVAVHSCQGPVLLGYAVDSAVGVRPAVDRQIELAAADPIDLAPLRIDAAEMGLQVRDGVAQGDDGGHIRTVVRMVGLGPHQHRQSRRAAGHVGAPVPVLQQRLGCLQVVIRAGIDLHHLGDHPRDLGAGAIGDVELVGAERRIGDGRIGAEGLLGAISPVGHVGLDAHGGAEVGGLQRVLSAGGLERGVVRVEHIAGFGIPDLGRALERQIAMPDQVGTVARLDLGPVAALGPGGELAIVDIADVPFFVGVDVVDAGQRLQTHGRQPLVAAARLVQPVVLQRLARLIHAGVADGEHPMVGPEHRPLGRPQQRPVHGPDQRPPQLYPDGGVALFEILPGPVQPVLIRIGRVDGHTVDGREARRIDRVGPAQMGVVAVQHEGRAGKEAPGHMPALAGIQHRLVPRGLAHIGLMGIDQQAGGAVRGLRGGHGHAVRADRKAGGHGYLVGGLRGRIEPADRIVEAVEEGRAEYKAGRHVLTGDRQDARPGLVRMQGRIIVEPVGIGLQHRAQVGRQVRGVPGRHRLAHPKQPHQIVGDRALGPLHAGQLAASGQHRLLQGGEIVLRMGEAKAERHVRVGGP